jgi:hypothetical protein
MSTLSNLLSDFFRTSERGVFWDHDKKANADPLEGLPNGFWDAVWDVKVSLDVKRPTRMLTNHHSLRSCAN